MIHARVHNFIDTSTLQLMNQELLNSSRWVYRTNFWRYYLVDNLQPYREGDPATWYGRQKDTLYASLKTPWRELFDRVFEFAGSNFLLQRYALTGQTQGQEQSMHPDTSRDLPGRYTSYLLYLNESWDPTWGGLTEFQTDSSSMHCEIPEPGKLVAFDSQAMHRGQAPSKSNVLRLSLVLHGKHIE